MEKKEDCFVCSRKVTQEKVKGSLKVKEWLDGIKDDEGTEILKGIREKYMVKGPTLVSVSAKKMITGTGIYKSECEPKLEMTFNQLVAAGEITKADEFEMTDSSFTGLRQMKLTVEEDGDVEMNSA